MEVGEVSTKTIPEIDLERSVTNRLTAAFGGAYDVPASEEERMQASTDADFSQVFDLPEPDAAWDLLARQAGTLGIRQCKPSQLQSAKQQKAVERLVSRITIDDLAPFLVRLSAQFDQGHERDWTTVRVKAITRWMRSVAEGAISRPIFEIDEARMTSVESSKSSEGLTVSPSLQRGTSTTRSRGLGYVSAGLLLWLESSESDDDDV